MRSEMENESEWFMGVGGVLSILFGILMLLHPTFGVLAFTSFIGIVAMSFGAQVMYVAARLKNIDIMMRRSDEAGEGQTMPVTVA